MRASRLLAGLSALLVWVAPGLPSVSAQEPETVSSAPPRSPAEELKRFRLPEGFVAELVAAEPEIHKPLNIAFDDKGRLWVTETLEYPFPAPAGRTPRDGVKILSDFGPDGHARSIKTFAEGLNIPIGLLPLPSGNEALVHSIPDVLRISDTDGDGRADQRVPFYQSIGFKDTHGMTNAFTWGFDGWIYACHGFSNESKLKGSDGKAFVMQSGNTYRMRPDGTHAELFTSGQVNPFGLAFDEYGNLYSCDCHTKPLYQLLRGGDYPGFGKIPDGLGFGPEMAAHDHGSTGIAGIVVYSADRFPKAYQGTVFVGNVVTNRINHDRIEWHGSSPKAIETPDFLVSDDPWFRPVDIKLGPDGALYVADFYNRIIGHYEVPLDHPGRDRERGRIWRIVYKGKDQAAKPGDVTDLTTASAAALIEALGHPNLNVRTRAANQLVGRLNGAERPVREVEAVVAGKGSAEKRVQALWVLSRWNLLTSELLLKALADPDPLVRVHALRVVGERPHADSPLTERVKAGLGDPDPHVRRAAAETAGRHGTFELIRPLLRLRRETPADDTHLIHTVKLSLRELLRDPAVWTQLASETLNPEERKGLAEVAVGTPTEAAAVYLLDEMRRGGGDPARAADEVRQVARFAPPARQPELLAVLEARVKSDPKGLARLFQAVQQGTQARGGTLDPAAVRLAVAVAGERLASPDEESVRSGIEIASSLRLREAAGRLTELANDPKRSEARRLDAMAALAEVDPEAAPGRLGAVLNDAASPPSIRERAAVLLSQSGRREARPILLVALTNTPEAVQTAVAAGLAARRDGAEDLLQAVATGKASARLLQTNRVATALAASKVPDLKSKLEGLLKGLPPADQRLGTLIAARRSGFGAHPKDADAGARIYQTQCAACHQIGGQGGRVGPQLDGIGARGADRLMEDILDPSRNVDQAFRATSLALKDGRVLSGLVLREEGAVLVMADAQGKDVRIPLDTVEERTISPVSPMPASFGDQIPETDFYRLLDFLVTKSKPAEAK